MLNRLPRAHHRRTSPQVPAGHRQRHTAGDAPCPATGEPPRWQGWHPPIPPVLIACLLLAFVLRVGAVIQFPNVGHADETFQTREPAHRLAYGYGVVTWEWHEGVRSWVFPAFLAAVMRGTDWLGAGSSGYLLGIAIVLSLLSLTTVWFSFMWASRTSGAVAAVIAAGASATWFELVYFGPKALTEVVGAHLLLPGLYLGMFGESIPERPRLFVSGLFCGLALALRAPLAPVVILSAAAFSAPNWRVRLLPFAAGVFAPVLVFGMVDAITWSYPFQSYVRLFWVDIVQGKGGEHGGGVRPWYWYVPMLALRFGPVALLALAGVRRSPFLGWVALVIVISHSLVGFKEFRYLYPVIPIAVTLAGMGMAEVLSPLRARARWLRSTTAACVVGLVIFTGTSLSFARFFPLWWRYSGNLIAFQELSRDARVCGVAIRVGEFGASGGYTYLHQNVPIFPISKEADLERLTPSFNVVVTTVRSQRDGFTLTRCWNGTCLYRRPGPCVPSPRDEINEVLKGH
jgi:GPI mannosyltransferase 3